MGKANRLRKQFDMFDLALCLVLGIGALLVVYPFYNCILISLVTTKEYVETPFMLIPRQLTLNSYAYVLNNEAIRSGFFITFILVVVGTSYNMLLTLATAYALSKKGYPGHTAFLNLIIFTMYFSGGIVPYYLLIRNLHLINSIYSMIIPLGINTFYMFIIMNYFRSLPKELEESACMDGANDVLIFIKIILPLSLPIVATFTLFYAVDRWNEWWNGMLFIKSPFKQPLQLVLRGIISVSATASVSEAAAVYYLKNMFTDGIKMASVVVSMIPVMCVYPFLQRCFLKGILIGAIKS